MRVPKTFSKEWKHFIEYSNIWKITIEIGILTLDRLVLLLNYQDIEDDSSRRLHDPW